MFEALPLEWLVHLGGEHFRLTRLRCTPLIPRNGYETPTQARDVSGVAPVEWDAILRPWLRGTRVKTFWSPGNQDTVTPNLDDALPWLAARRPEVLTEWAWSNLHNAVQVALEDGEVLADPAVCWVGGRRYDGSVSLSTLVWLLKPPWQAANMMMRAWGLTSWRGVRPCSDQVWTVAQDTGALLREQLLLVCAADPHLGRRTPLSFHLPAPVPAMQVSTARTPATAAASLGRTLVVRARLNAKVARLRVKADKRALAAVDGGSLGDRGASMLRVQADAMQEVLDALA